MPYEGYAGPIMYNGLGFHSNMPISELTECVTRAIEASDVNSIPPVAKTTDEATMKKMSRPSIRLLLRVGARGKLDSQGDRTCGRRMIDPRRGRNKEKTFSDPPNLTAIPQGVRS